MGPDEQDRAERDKSGCALVRRALSRGSLVSLLPLKKKAPAEAGAFFLLRRAAYGSVYRRLIQIILPCASRGAPLGTYQGLRKT